MSTLITSKKKLELYIFFILIGIVSEIISRVIPLVLTTPVEYLQGTLYDMDLLDVSFDLVFMLSFLLPFLVCSVLLTIVFFYIQEERSLIFTLKIFSIFMVISLLSFIFFIRYSFLVFLLLLILFITGSVALKHQPSIQMSIKAIAISFSVLFLILSIGFVLSAYQHEIAKGIDISKVDTVDKNTVIIEIFDNELEEFPELRNAITQCREFNACWHYIHPDEWMKINDFLERKKHEKGYLFSIPPEIKTKLPIVSQNLDKSPSKLQNIPMELINIFELNNVTISELTYIQYNDYNQNWQIFERQFLLKTDNPALKEKLDNIEVSEGVLLEEDKKIKIPELNTAFESRGILLSKYYWITRDDDNWLHIIEAQPEGIGDTFDIWEISGYLMVYTPEKKIYEIWKEDGNLNVYDGNTVNYEIFKVGEEYYSFVLWLA